MPTSTTLRIPQCAIADFFQMDWLEAPKEFYHRPPVRTFGGVQDDPDAWAMDGLLGLYRSGENAVELYVENIVACAKTLGCDAGDLLDVVRIHEYGHALHCLGWADFARRLHDHKYKEHIAWLAGPDSDGDKELDRAKLVKVFKLEFNEFGKGNPNNRTVGGLRIWPDCEWVAQVFTLLFVRGWRRKRPGLEAAFLALHRTFKPESAYCLGDKDTLKRIEVQAEVKARRGAKFSDFISRWAQPCLPPTAISDDRRAKPSVPPSIKARGEAGRSVSADVSPADVSRCKIERFWQGVGSIDTDSQDDFDL